MGDLMGSKDGKTEWEKLKAGKLEEGQHDELGLRTTSRTPGHVLLKTRIGRQFRPSVPVRKSPELYSRIRGLGLGPTSKVRLTPFHLEVSFISRHRPQKLPPSVIRGTHVALYPNRKQVKQLRSQSAAKWNWRYRIYTTKAGDPFLKTPAGITMSSPFAAARRLERQNAHSNFSTRGTSKDFQIYLERASGPLTKILEQVEADTTGLISFGTIGKDFATRLLFWEVVEKRELRVGARLQSRIIAELPYWISSEARREIAERFSAEFRKRNLPFWIVIHRPSAKNGSDQRNFHMHVVFHDRPLDHEGSWTPGISNFLESKFRPSDASEWIIELRKKFADAVNDVVIDFARRTRVLPPRVFHFGNYASLGLSVEPQKHLGPRMTAISRQGELPRRAAENFTIQEHALWNRADHLISRIEDFSATINSWRPYVTFEKITSSNHVERADIQNALTILRGRNHNIVSRHSNCHAALSHWKKVVSESVDEAKIFEAFSRLEDAELTFEEEFIAHRRARDTLEKIRRAEMAREQARQISKRDPIPPHPVLPISSSAEISRQSSRREIGYAPMSPQRPRTPPMIAPAPTAVLHPPPVTQPPQSSPAPAPPLSRPKISERTITIITEIILPACRRPREVFVAMANNLIPRLDREVVTELIDMIRFGLNAMKHEEMIRIRLLEFIAMLERRQQTAIQKSSDAASNRRRGSDHER